MTGPAKTHLFDCCGEAPLNREQLPINHVFQLFLHAPLLRVTRRRISGKPLLMCYVQQTKRVHYSTAGGGGGGDCKNQRAQEKCSDRWTQAVTARHCRTGVPSPSDRKIDNCEGEGAVALVTGGNGAP